MGNNEDAAVAVVHRVDPRWWSDGFGALVGRRGPLFPRFEPRRPAVGWMLGLLSGLDCKNCWTIAELRGAAPPNERQHRLSRARGDADAARDVLRTYVLEVFADPPRGAGGRGDR